MTVTDLCRISQVLWQISRKFIQYWLFMRLCNLFSETYLISVQGQPGRFQIWILEHSSEFYKEENIV